MVGIGEPTACSSELGRDARVAGLCSCDELSDPLSVIDRLYEQHTAALDRGAPAGEWGERDHFVRALGLQDEENFARIVCVNDLESAADARPFSMVRFRAMVQDVFEPELYTTRLEERPVVESVLAAAPTFRTTKYRDCVSPRPGFKLMDPDRHALGQRGACYCVPLPGETAWSRATTARASASASAATALRGPGPLKRGRDDGHPEHLAEATTSALAVSRMRLAQPADLDRALCPPPPSPDLLPEISFCDPSPCPNGDQFGLNFPLPDEVQPGRGCSVACIVKLYDGDADSLRVCDTVEVLGVLCMYPEFANFGAVPDVLGSDARHPSTSLVPRLHAVLVRKLPFYHPMLPFTLDFWTEERLAGAYERSFASPALLHEARAAALETLCMQVGGDKLAAQYLLMLLVSRSFGRHGDMSLGVWSLNLACFPEDCSVERLSEALASLVPRMAKLELTPTALCRKAWYPRKDFEANRLVAGQLQLAGGTALILDETRMPSGALPEAAAKALSACGSIAFARALECDFCYSSFSVPLELQTVLVSKRRSVIGSAEVVLPMAAAEKKDENCPPTPSPAASLGSARLLLGLLTRRPKPLSIPAAVAEQLSADFAAARAASPALPGGLCHTWLGLARAFCLLSGQRELTLESWREVHCLEKERLGRCDKAGLLLAV